MDSVPGLNYSAHSFGSRERMIVFNLLPNKVVEFGSGRNSADALVEGWSGLEAGQVWSDGPHALLRFSADAIPYDSRLVIHASPQLVDGLEEQRIAVFANGLYVRTLLLTRDGTMTLTLPSFVTVSVMMVGSLDLAFSIPDCRPPGGTSDRRKLGFALHTLELRTT